MKRRKQVSKSVACQKRRFRRSNGDDWYEPAYAEEQDTPEVIKGTSRRVVVVQPETETIFEQIIYIVRDDALIQSGVSAAEVLNQAAAAVHPRMKAAPKQRKQRSRLTDALLWLSGVALTLAVGIGAYWYLV